MTTLPRHSRLNRAARRAAVAVGVLALPLAGDAYTLSTAARILAIGLLAAAVAIVTGQTGLPTLGQTAPYAAGAYTAAFLAIHLHTMAVLQVAAGAVAGASLAAVVGLLLAHTRAATHLMITVAVGQAVVTAAGDWTPLTGGSNGLLTPTVRPLPDLPILDSDLAIYLYTATVAGLALAVAVVVVRGPWGMLLRAVRDQEPRMVASGHPTSRYLHLAHCAAGALAGIGGALLVTVQQTVTPGDVDFDTASLALLACVLGGGRLRGAVAGVAVILIVRDVIASPFAGHGPLLVGTLYLAAAYLLHSRPGRQLTSRVSATIGRLRPRPADGPPLPARAGETPDAPDTVAAAPDAVAAGGPR